MPICLVANLPNGATKVSCYDDGIVEGRKRDNPPTKRVSVYKGGSIIYDSGAAMRYGTQRFSPEAIAAYHGQAERLDEEFFL